MPRIPLSVAQDERYHLLLTVWASPEHRRLGGDSWRVATGVLSSDGSTIEVTNRVGDVYPYPCGLDSSLSVTALLSTVAQSVQVTIAWGRDTQPPGDMDLRNAVGEISLINETNGGRSVEAWESRLMLVYGRVSNLTWGDSRQTISFSLASAELVDSGDFYAVGAELTAERFADIGNTSGSRNRAPNADGLLPVVAYAPAGSSMRVPCQVVVDETDASPGVSDLVPRRWLLGYRRPAQTVAVEQFVAVDPDDDNRPLWGTTFVPGQKVPQSATDLLGDVYWYVLGDFELTFGSGATTLTGPAPGPASDIMTASRTQGYARKDWQVRGTIGADDDYRVVLSDDGTTFELGDSAGTPQTYQGASIVNGTGQSIPIPANRADGLYWLVSNGGVVGNDGETISQVIDVLVDWLRSSRFDVPVAIGDLMVLKSRLAGWHLSWICRERGQPWTKALDVLRYLPIRPYLSEGALRFAWVGAVDSRDIVTTIDLDVMGQAWRVEPVSWVDEQSFPSVRLRSSWDVWYERFQQTLAIDGSRSDYSDPRKVSTGRALRAYRSWRDQHGPATPSRVPFLDVEADTLETTHGVEMAALWLAYRWSSPRQRLVLTGDGSLRYIMPGDAIRVIESARVTRSQVWRVEGVTFDGAGGIRLLLETIA